MIWIPIALIFAGYASFSLLLFFFPNILHLKYRYKHQPFNEAVTGNKILRITHRGGPRYTTQNTIEAFKNAAPHSDMLEMDVCETKDGILVVHHDHDLQRTCGVKGFIRDYNYEDLPPFKKQIELNFAEQGRTIKSNGEKIPTLEEVFQEFPDIPINIEIKTPSENAVDKLNKIVAEHQRKNITIIGIRGQMQDHLRQADFQNFRFINDSTFAFLAITYFTGLLPFIFIQERTLQLPLFTQEFYRWKQREWGNNWKTELFFKGLKIMNLIFRPFVYHLRQRGIMTYFWVCNTQQQFQRAINCGGCGIMTDDPILLDNFIKKQNKIETNESPMPANDSKKYN